jgi:hypothetical protein
MDVAGKSESAATPCDIGETAFDLSSLLYRRLKCPIYNCALVATPHVANLKSQIARDHRSMIKNDLSPFLQRSGEYGSGVQIVEVAVAIC